MTRAQNKCGGRQESGKKARPTKKTAGKSGKKRRARRIKRSDSTFNEWLRFADAIHRFVWRRQGRAVDDLMQSRCRCTCEDSRWHRDITERRGDTSDVLNSFSFWMNFGNTVTVKYYRTHHWIIYTCIRQHKSLVINPLKNAPVHNTSQPVVTNTTNGHNHCSHQSADYTCQCPLECACT